MRAITEQGNRKMCVTKNGDEQEEENVKIELKRKQGEEAVGGKQDEGNRGRNV